MKKAELKKRMKFLESNSKHLHEVIQRMAERIEELNAEVVSHKAKARSKGS